MALIARAAAGSLLAAALAAPAGAVPLDRTVLVSARVGNAPLVQPLVNHSQLGSGRSVSADGRYVVFTSDADGLSTDDVDSVTNIFVRDRQTELTILVSRANGADGAGADGASFDPVISSNGQWVAFSSSATNLSGADEGGVPHIFLRNLVTGTTTLVDRADGPSGVIGNDAATEPSVSNDGDVAFTSSATNLDPLVAAGTLRHVYVRDRFLDDTRVVDLAHNTANTIADTGASEPTIAGDGAAVAFTSAATNLGIGANPLGATQVYWRSLTANTTKAVSANAPLGNGDSYDPSISDDATRVAFATDATDLDQGPEFPDTDTTPDVYVWTDLAIDTRTLVSRQSGTGAKGTSSAVRPIISPDGRAVAFVTTSALEPAQDTNAEEDVYVRHLGDAPPQAGANTTRVVSRAAGGGPALGALGGVGSPTSLSGGFGVAFSGFAPGVVADDDDEFVAVWYRLTVPIVLSVVERNTLVSRPSGSDPFRAGVSRSDLRGGARSESALRALSADGRRVVFVSDDDTLASDDDDRVQNVFVRDVLTGETQLVSRASGASGAAGSDDSATFGFGLSGRAVPPAISADGTKVVFVSAAPNLVPGDANGQPDVFLRDLATDTTTRLSVGPGGSEIPTPSVDGTISGDGRVVAFATAAALDPADTNAEYDIYVKTLATGAVELASRADGAAGLVDPNDGASEPSLDFDGSRVAFNGGELAPVLDDQNGITDVFLRDLATDETVIVSQRSSPGQPRTGNGFSFHAAIDAAGNRVAFMSTADDLVAIDSNGGGGDVFVRDIAAGTTVTASAANGTATEVPGFVNSVSISDDGTRVAFVSSGASLVAGDTNGLPDLFVRDLDTLATTLVSRGDGGASVGASSFGAISGNGDCAAFASTDDTAAPGLPIGTDFSRVFLRTLRLECPLDPPQTTIQGKTATRDRTPTFTLVSDEAGSTFTCRRGSAAFAPCAASVTLPSLKDGRYTLQAIATDPAGQVDPSAASLTFRVDTRRPVIRSASIGSPLRTSKRLRVRLSEAASLKITFQRRVGSRWRTVRTVTRSLKAGRRSTTLRRTVAGKRLAAGRYRLRLVATDAAGNRSRTRTVSLRVG